MVRQLLGNCDDLIFDGFGVVTWVEIQGVAAFEPQILLVAFDCAFGCGVVIDTASVSKLTKIYHRFNDAARHDIPLLFSKCEPNPSFIIVSPHILRISQCRTQSRSAIFPWC